MPRSVEENEDNLGTDSGSNGAQTEVQMENLRSELARKQQQIESLQLQLGESEQKNLHAIKVQQALYQISKLASGAEDIISFYQSIHSIISKLLYAENFYVALQSSNKKILEIVYFVDSIDSEYTQTKNQAEILVDGKSLSARLFSQKDALLLSKEKIVELESEKKVEVLGTIPESWLGAVLKSEAECLGILVVQSYDEKYIFQGWQRELFEYISNTIALAVERKLHRIRLEQAIQERTREISLQTQYQLRHQKTEKVLLKIADLANSKITLKKFFNEIHKLIETIIYAENFYIVIKDRESGMIEFSYYEDSLDENTIEELNKIPQQEIEKSVTGYLLNSGLSFLTDAEGIKNLCKKENLSQRGPRPVSWLGTPLVLDGEILGVMTLQSYSEFRRFSESDQQLMEYVAKSVANAIQRKTAQRNLEKLVEKRTADLKEVNQALTFEIEEKSKAEKLQNALYQIANLALGAEQMSQFYKQIHQILCYLFYAENFYIALVDKKTDRLNFHYFCDLKDELALKDYSINLKEKSLSTYLFNSCGSLLLDKNNFLKLSESENIELIGSQFESWLGVTLKDEEESIGILVIQSYRKDVIYEKWHKELLEFVAHHVAIAVNKKKNHEALEKKVLLRTKELQNEIETRKNSEFTQAALYQIADLANMDLNLDLFYRELHYIVSSLVYCENFYIALKEQHNDSIRMVYFVDTVDDNNIDSIAAIPIEILSQSLTAYVMKQSSPLLATEKEISELVEKESLTLHGADTVSWLGIPLVIEQEVIGIMTLQSYLPSRIYQEKDKELMIFVGQHVATAIQRKRNKDYLKLQVAQRTEELKKTNQKLTQQILVAERAKQLQTALFQITDLASSAQNMSELYAEVHRIISQLIYAENLYICLFDEVKQNLKFVYFIDKEDYLDKTTVKKLSLKDIKGTTTGKVLLSGKSVLRTPKNKLEVYEESPKYIGKESLYWLGVPLKIDSNIIGIIAIQSYDSNKVIGQEEQELLEFVSHHIALTLERKQAQKALEKRVEERTRKLAETNSYLQQQIIERKRSESVQAALYYVSKLANENISLQELFAKIHFAIKSLVYAENFYIAVWDKLSDEMNWVYMVDSDHQYDYDSLKELSKEAKNKSLAKLVIKTSKLLHIDKKHINYLNDSGEIQLYGTASEFYLGIPLIFSDGVRGVMAVQSYDKKINFSQADEELLVFVAQSIVSTIEKQEYRKGLEERVKKRTYELTLSNQRLQQEILQRKESENLQNALYKISETPHFATEYELYRRLHEIISKLMYAKSFYIALVDKQKNVFNFEYIADAIDKNIPETMPIGKSLTSYVYNNRCIVHLNREQIVELEKTGIILHQGNYAVDWIGVPLMSGDEIFGIMIIQSYDEKYLYGDKEIEILSFVSTHIADALQRKSAEKALKKAYSDLAEKTKKAEEANEAKSAFLATVSHEIRTPMNGILGMLCLLDDTPLNQKQQDYVNKTLVSAKSLLGIINDILDFSKMEQGKMELEEVSFNLSEILDNLIDLFATRLNEKELDFNLIIKPNVNLMRVGDPLRVSQVLINLVGNAVKFTDKGFIVIKIQENISGQLFFSVEDSGIGISSEQKEKIFQSFTQADDTTTRRFGGSGLGLSICQQLVQLMGGEIVVNSELDKGSQFSFTVNIAEQPSSDGDNQLKIDANVLYFSNCENQIQACQYFCERYNVGFQYIKDDNISDATIKEILTKKITHVFVEYDCANKLIFNMLKQWLDSNHDMTCFVLVNSAKVLSSYSWDRNVFKVVNVPLKKKTLIKLLKNDLEILNTTRFNNTQDYSSFLINRKILLAEDNPVNQQVAREILEKSGADVVIVDNGLDALAEVKKQRFDLILMDIQMPKMDGYIASQEIRKTYTLEELPIIAMTANVMRGDREKCLSSGMNDYIGKPIDIDYLFKVIDQYFESNFEFKKYLFEEPDDIQLIEQEENNEPPFIFEDIITKFESEELALDLVNIFYKTHELDPHNVEKYVKDNNLKQAQKRIHKLKGSAGEMGMDLLLSHAGKLDTQLKNKLKPGRQDLKAFVLELESTLSCCEKIIKKYNLK